MKLIVGEESCKNTPKAYDKTSMKKIFIPYQKKTNVSYLPFIIRKTTAAATLIESTVFIKTKKQNKQHGIQMYEGRTDRNGDLYTAYDVYTVGESFLG